MEKKEVLITTWFGPGNYGTALQALALKQYLENCGYSVFFLEDHRNVIDDNKGKGTRRIVISFIRKVFSAKKWKKVPYRRAIKNKAVLQKQYLDKYIPVVSIFSTEDVQRLIKKADVFVSGGDQIWNPYVTNPGFMLDFVPSNKTKISYGTSVGVKTIPEAYIELYKYNLSQYRNISVREEQSAKALQAVLNRNVDVVLDPTLLFSGEEWSFLMSDAKIDPVFVKTPYILVYFVGTRRSYWNYVSKMKAATGYEVIVVPINDEAYRNSFKKYVEVSPAEFLKLINNAEIVCTDSYHATVFSILFGKEFYTLKRFSDTSTESQNGRLEYLLAKYELTDRLIENENSFKRLDKVDYSSIHASIEQERNMSKQWLRSAMEK